MTDSSISADLLEAGDIIWFENEWHLIENIIISHSYINIILENKKVVSVRFYKIRRMRRFELM